LQNSDLNIQHEVASLYTKNGLGGEEVWRHSFLIPVVGRGERSTWHCQSLYCHGKSIRCPLNLRLDGPRNQSGGFGE